jgi:serine/threonine protein kinase/Tol biopolymer transport system component
MKPEDLHQVDEIFQAALDLAPEQRSAYLDQACAGDKDLRQEVASLISSYGQSSKFMETPAIEVDAAIIAGSESKPAGRLVGHYQIIQRLGVGGMGEVYLASDTRTDRRVALKVLPHHLLNDDERVRRFQQEARAALALNHPNIVTIFEIGDANGEQFIASEWIQGETLRALIDHRSLSIEESLDIAIQVAAGLTEAHGHGIIHRDIKPENVMLRPDGYVKVLDFGIAKLTDLRRPVTASEDPTALKIQTAPQMVLGTLNYMSPEQARAQPVDERTDTWSLGVLLYEMITGHPPFAGDTSSDVMASILEKRPAPLARYARDVPDALEDIVTMALAKNRDERYQTATQMMAAMRRLKQRLDLASELEHSEIPASRELADPNRTSAAPNLTDAAAATTTGQRASSAEYIVSEIKRHRWGAAGIFGLLLLFAVGVIYGVYRWTTASKTTAQFQPKMTRLTTSGKAADATISADGKFVAYINLDEGGRMSIWLRQVATASNVKIVDTAQMGVIGFPRGLTFSPDGNYLYFRARNETPRGGGNVYALFRVPVPLGGDVQKVIDSIYSPVSFSPDGKRIAFVRNNKPVLGESNLVVANADDTDERIIDKHKLDKPFAAPNWPMTPAWSPDGKKLVSAAGTYPSTLIEVQVDNGAERPIGPQHWPSIDHLAWLPDGSALLLTAQEEASSRMQLWQVSYPSGEARRITNELNSYRGLSLTADAGTIAVVQTVIQSDIWIMPYGKTGEARRLTSGTGTDDNGYHGLSWAPNGKLIYASSATGILELWSIDASGGNPKQLSSDPYRYDEPIVTPDGRYIVFFSDRTGPMNLWRTDVDGRNPKQLTTGKLASVSACVSPDGKLIIYSSLDAQGTPVLWSIGIDGGAPVQLTDDTHWAELPSVSPDGTQIVCDYFGGGQPASLGTLPIGGGQITHVADLPQRIFRELRWTPDGTSVAYIQEREGTQNLQIVPIGAGGPKQLTDFKEDQNFIFYFDWSHDGKQLAVARGTQISDVVLINNFK